MVAEQLPAKSEPTLPAACAILIDETKRLRIDEEYRIPNGTGERSKDQDNYSVPGPQNGHRFARGPGCNPEPAHQRANGAFQIEREGPSFPQGSPTDGRTAAPFARLPA